MTGLTRDGVLGGRLRLWQPRRGYRFGSDSVLLAAFVPAHPGQSLLDLGCGVGTVALCVAARVGEMRLTGVDLQPEYVEIFKRNADESDIEARAVCADARCLADVPGNAGFDHVVTNPPWFDRTRGNRAVNDGREAGRGAGVALHEWLDIAIRHLTPGGTLTLIERPQQLGTILDACHKQVGALQILPVASRPGGAARLVLIRGKRGLRTPLRLYHPFTTHLYREDGNNGGAAGPADVSPAARAILRDGAPLLLPGD